MTWATAAAIDGTPFGKVEMPSGAPRTTEAWAPWREAFARGASVQELLELELPSSKDPWPWDLWTYHKQRMAEQVRDGVHKDTVWLPFMDCQSVFQKGIMISCLQCPVATMRTTRTRVPVTIAPLEPPSMRAGDDVSIVVSLGRGRRERWLEMAAPLRDCSWVREVLVDWWHEDEHFKVPPEWASRMRLLPGR